MIRLSQSSQSVLDLLNLGLTRSEVARRRGVTKEAISHTVKRLKQLGYSVPDPQPKPSPQMDKARKFFAAGYSAKEVAGFLNVSHGRGCNLRRQWLEGRAG